MDPFTTKGRNYTFFHYEGEAYFVFLVIAGVASCVSALKIGPRVVDYRVKQLENQKSKTNNNNNNE